MQRPLTKDEPLTEPLVMVEFARYVALPDLLEVMATYMRDLGEQDSVWSVSILDYATGEDLNIHWTGRLFISFAE